MIRTVEMLRGMAALLVVIHHAQIKASQYLGATETFHIGWTGVDLFFIISGYVMCASTIKGARPLKFLERRCVRILPLYYTLTTAALAIYLVAPSKINAGSGHTSLFLSYFLWPTRDRLLIANGWTLSYEFFFYITLAVCLPLRPRNAYIATSVALLSFSVVAMFLIGNDPTFPIATVMPEFVLGMLAYHLLAKIDFSWAARWLLMLCGVAGLMAENFGWVHLPRLLWVGIPYFLLFLGFVACERWVVMRSERLPAKALLLMGAASYSLYLVHPFVQAGAAMAFKALGLLGVGAALFEVGLVVIALPAAVVCYRLLEIPLDRWLRVHLALPAHARLGAVKRVAGPVA